MKTKLFISLPSILRLMTHKKILKALVFTELLKRVQIQLLFFLYPRLGILDAAKIKIKLTLQLINLWNMTISNAIPYKRYKPNTRLIKGTNQLINVLNSERNSKEIKKQI